MTDEEQKAWEYGYPPDDCDWDKYEVYFAPLCVWHRLKADAMMEQRKARMG